MKVLKHPEPATWKEILKRPSIDDADIEQIVSQVFEDVKAMGDKAVLKYTNIFDRVILENIKVTNPAIENATKLVSVELKNAIAIAKQNIECFHRAQKTNKVSVETMPGVSCWQKKRPIQSVGLYIPGGTAPLFSTVLMLAIPAKIAGCENIILCTPPNSEGKIANEILYTAQLCGVSKIYAIGGIQAIAALTFGTKTIPQVYKIFGPGNQYVTAAKQWATKFGVAIDMPAGPSELFIVADDSAHPNFVASDLLSQAEHGTDSQVLLVSTSMHCITAVIEAMASQLKILPRAAIAHEALKHAKAILIKDKYDALKLVNQHGPEHLILATKDNSFFMEHIINAGSVFVGNYTPESAGDYASGTNHTLPTNGFSKAYSGVNLDSFQKCITFQEITKEGLKNLGPSIEVMADAEGLQAHKNAVSIRLNDLK